MSHHIVEHFMTPNSCGAQTVLRVIKRLHVVLILMLLPCPLASHETFPIITLYSFQCAVIMLKNSLRAISCNLQSIPLLVVGFHSDGCCRFCGYWLVLVVAVVVVVVVVVVEEEES